MKPKTFLSQIDDRLVLEAIAAAERASSGEVRVYVSDKEIEDVLSEAKVQFLRLGMDKTRARNGVLIYIAPRSQKFAVVGDVAVHQLCGDRLWQGLAAGMEAHLKEARYTEALVAAIQQIAAVLATHFPRQANDQNELPDELSGDPP